MIKKYGLFIGLLMVSSSVCAMEKQSNDGKQSKWHHKIGDALLWVIKPFEVVDSDDVVRRKYKQEIMDNWDKICTEDKGIYWSQLNAEQKKKQNYRRYKLENLQTNRNQLPTRDQILVWKYDYKCIWTRWIPRFLHGSPYSYFATSLYYCALLNGSVKGYKKVKRLLNRNKNKEKNSAQRTLDHKDCPWCMAHNQQKTA